MRSLLYIVILLVVLQPFSSLELSLTEAQAQASSISFDGCVAYGKLVPSIADASLNNIAVARLDPSNSPVIFYNPNITAHTSLPTNIFFYYHECAHHILGHTVGLAYPLIMEQQADCLAIQTLVQTGRFGSQEIKQVQQDISMFANEDWTHINGPQRAINLAACLG